MYVALIYEPRHEKLRRFLHIYANNKGADQAQISCAYVQADQRLCCLLSLVLYLKF